MRGSMWEVEGVERIFEVNALPMGFLERLLSKYVELSDILDDGAS